MITRLCLAAAVLLAAGCARAGQDEARPTPAATTALPAGTTVPATPPPTVDPTTEPATDPPPPLGTLLPPDVPGYLAALREVSPELAADPARAVRRGQDTCQEVLAGKPASMLVANAAARFSDAGTTLGTAADARIVAAAQGYLCPGAGPGR